MDLTTVEKIRWAFYRLVGSLEDDDALIEQGEAVNEVAYQFLSRGCRSAQLSMLKYGYGGWRKRSAALTWSGSDDADGGRYVALPADFLRLYGNEKMSALVEANGRQWGTQTDPDNAYMLGNFYYLLGETLWITRQASPPTTLYALYHFAHPEWSDTVTIDFPIRCRPLIVAEAASVAKQENWLTGGPELESKIDRALMQARGEAQEYSRGTKQPRKVAKPLRYGNPW